MIEVYCLLIAFFWAVLLWSFGSGVKRNGMFITPHKDSYQSYCPCGMQLQYSDLTICHSSVFNKPIKIDWLRTFIVINRIDRPFLGALNHTDYCGFKCLVRYWRK